MPEPLAIRVRNALSLVENPATGRSIVSEGLIQGLTTDDDGQVRFTLELPGFVSAAAADALLNAAKAAAGAVDGVSSVSAVATAHSAKPSAPKQTAVALPARGLKTGFLDADIYGPSAPTLFGVADKAAVKDGRIMPVNAHGVTVMSIGMIVDPDQALAWRGPMVMGALGQLMRDVEWGALDVMIVDTPPGTGDAHLSLIQSKRLDGAVIVSTPQEMALADVRRGVALFRKTDVPIIGVIENMAWLESDTGERQYLFGEGGARRAAEKLDAPFLGAIPLYPALRAASDEGRPLAASNHPAADVFKELAEKLAGALSL